jgi:hypothetical protein
MLNTLSLLVVVAQVEIFQVVVALVDIAQLH